MALPPAGEAEKRATHPGIAPQPRFLAPGQTRGTGQARFGREAALAVRAARVTFSPSVTTPALLGASDGAAVMFPSHGGN